MRIIQDRKLDFDDVLLTPQRTRTASRKEVIIEREFKFYHSPRVWHGIPIVAANMANTGTIAMANLLATHKLVTALHKHYDIKDYIDILKQYQDYVWFSMGIKDKDIWRLKDLIYPFNIIPNIVIDVANGYTDDFVDFCANVRALSPDSIIVAGNVCTPEMVQELILHGGVDIVKIGIGPGSHCSTRMVTGVGYPQLSAIMECSHVAHGLKSEERRMGLIMADGGCKTPGDVCKAFAANADFVMLGGMFMGCDENEGEWEYEWEHPNYIGTLLNDEPPTYWSTKKRNDNTGRKRKKQLKTYGMSSYHAQQQHTGQIANYRASEGEVKWTPFKSSASSIVQEILGGIRSCCAYIGATSIKDMAKCAEFCLINRIK